MYLCPFFVKLFLNGLHYRTIRILSIFNYVEILLFIRSRIKGSIQIVLIVLKHNWSLIQRYIKILLLVRKTMFES